MRHTIKLTDLYIPLPTDNVRIAGMNWAKELMSGGGSGRVESNPDNMNWNVLVRENPLRAKQFAETFGQKGVWKFNKALKAVKSKYGLHPTVNYLPGTEQSGFKPVSTTDEDLGM